MHGKLFITVVAYVSCVQFTAAYNFLRNFLYDLRTKMFHAAVTEQDFYEVFSVYNHIVKCK